MSVYFVTGKPGGGKSLYGLMLIVEALLKTRQSVITNLSVNPGELNAYIQEKHPEADVDLMNRLFLIDEEQTFRFYRHRPHGFVFDEPEEKTERMQFKECTCTNGEVTVVKRPQELGPVLYVIDEIHEFFNAREWMKTGKHMLSYISQHRKLGDDVIAITQALSNVEKQLRVVAQEYICLRNHSKEKFGWFRSFDAFSRRHYLSPPTGGPGDVCTSHRFFRLDAEGLGACYNTAAGVGIAGEAADKGQKAKGIPPVAVGVGLAVLLVALIFIPLGGMRWLMGASPIADIGAEATGAVIDAPAVTEPKIAGARPTQTSTVTGSTNTVATAAQSSPVPELPARRLVGITRVSGVGTAYFDDGLQASEGHPKVFKIGSDFAIYEGVFYELQRKPLRPQPKRRAGGVLAEARQSFRSFSP